MSEDNSAADTDSGAQGMEELSHLVATLLRRAKHDDTIDMQHPSVRSLVEWFTVHGISKPRRESTEPPATP